MRKMISLLICSLIITFIFRIIIVRNSADLPKVMFYQMQEEVKLDNDFFDDSQENMNGYSVKVIKTELLTKNEIEKKYGKITSFYNFDYILIVSAEFKNFDNDRGEKSGIDLSKYIFQENSYINYFDEDLFKQVNHFESYRFCLKKDSIRCFDIPFIINTNQISIKRFKKGNPSLIVSLYPNKKTILLK